MGVPAGNAENGKKIFVQRCAQCHTPTKEMTKQMTKAMYKESDQEEYDANTNV